MLGFEGGAGQPEDLDIVGKGLPPFLADRLALA